MENIEIEKRKKSKTESNQNIFAKSKNQEDDFEFNFVPITEGLGFNSRVKTEETVQSSQSRFNKLVTSETSNKKFNRESLPSGLSQFYQPNTKVVENTVEKSVTSNEKPFEDAKGSEIFFSAMIDFMVVAAGYLVTIFSFSFLAGLEFFDFISLFKNIEFIVINLVIFSSYFLFYFSFLNCSEKGTLGKMLMGLRTIGADRKPPKFVNSIIHSFLWLIGFYTLGLFSLLEINEKLGQVKIVKV